MEYPQYVNWIIPLIGIKEDEEKLYEIWKEHYPNQGSPLEMLRSVYFPIEYDESLFKYYNTERSPYYNFKNIWYTIPQENWLEIMRDWKMDKIWTKCKMATHLMGMIPLIKVGNDRYIQYCDNQSVKVDLDNKITTYWHGIQLKNANINTFMDIIGISVEKGVVNIINNNIIPNVARDKLAYDDEEKIELAIKRATYQYEISKLNDLELKTVLQDYMNSNYPADNPFCIN